MGKKGKKAAAGKAKKLTPKDIGKKLDALVKKLEEELKGADLFAPLPPMEDCAICFLPLSRASRSYYYQACCGKTICEGCFDENKAVIKKQNAGREGKKLIPHTCPFCREPEQIGVDYFRLLEAKAATNDFNALNNIGMSYMKGDPGYEVRRDELKGLDYWIRAAELGSENACYNIALNYRNGKGVPQDEKKAALFEQVAALRGCMNARHNIGHYEYNAGNHELGIRHMKISAEAGDQHSLNELREIYNADGKMPGKEFISKDELDRIYRAGHEAQEEIKSDEREKHRDYDEYE